MDSVWDAWTKEDLITEWFPPEANIEVKLGGSFELFFDPKNHNHQSTIGCVFTKVEPKKCINFTWKGPDQFADFMNVSSSLTSVMVTFSEDGDNIVVKLEHKGWGESDRWLEARNWHQNQWEILLHELKSLLES